MLCEANEYLLDREEEGQPKPLSSRKSTDENRMTRKVREQVKHCDKNCWMIGSASPAMKQRIWVPGWWIVKHKLMGNKYRLSENKFMR